MCMTEQTELAKHGEYKTYIEVNTWTDEKLVEQYITNNIQETCRTLHDH